MNKLNNLDKKKKIILISSIITLIILGIVSATVAYFAWVGEESSISVTVIGGEGECSVKEDNNVFLEPTDTKNNGRIIKFTAKQTLAQEAYIIWTMNINSVNELNHNTFRYEMINTTTGASYGSGDFADVTDGSFIRFRNDQEVLTINQTYEFALYLWIDGTIGNNPVTMAGKELDFDMNCSIFDDIGDFTGGTIADFIKYQYVKGIPTLITQKDTDGNEIANYYYSYQDSEQTWGLMNDGLKIDTSLDATTTGLATTVTSTEALTSGTEGNIRYFGPRDKVNNYIYFNCSDYSKQTDSTCEKWRIMGIVDGKVKIIRNESIGKLAWDQDKNQVSSLTTYNNNWTNSSLQEFLNGLYYNRGTIESHPYYSGSDGSTTTTLNLKTIGITEATRNIISESTWYLGGKSLPSGLYPNDIYTYERTNKVGTTINSSNPFTLENTKIGLMYPSDYGYATNLKECSKDICSYEKFDACTTNNWLFNSSNQWLITPNLSYSSYAWVVSSSGFAHFGNFVYHANYGVRPVLYLDSELTIESEGDGSSANPYRISVS